MKTEPGGIGPENGPGSWAKFADITGVINTESSFIFLVGASNLSLLTPATCLITVNIGMGASTLDADYTSIDVVHTDIAIFPSANFKLIGTGTALQLWYKKPINYGTITVTELSKANVNNHLYLYNDGASWQSAAPTGAVNITSDYAGRGTAVPVAEGSTDTGVGTYIAQATNYGVIRGVCIGTISIGWSAHTGTGNLRVTLPFPKRAGSARGSFTIGRMVGLTRPSSDFVSAYVEDGTNKIFLMTTNSAGAETEIAMDTAVTLIEIAFAYEV